MNVLQVSDNLCGLLPSRLSLEKQALQSRQVATITEILGQLAVTIQIKPRVCTTIKITKSWKEVLAIGPFPVWYLIQCVLVLYCFLCFFHRKKD
jgi:hypothetical protein